MDFSLYNVAWCGVWSTEGSELTVEIVVIVFAVHVAPAATSRALAWAGAALVA